jgi:hypothetical protein
MVRPPGKTQHYCITLNIRSDRVENYSLCRLFRPVPIRTDTILGGGTDTAAHDHVILPRSAVTSRREADGQGRLRGTKFYVRVDGRTIY